MGDSCVARRMLRYSAIQGSRCLLAALAVGIVGVVLANPLAQLVDPAAELLQGLDHRLDPLRAQAEFLDQPHGPPAAAAQPPPGRPALGRRRATCWWRCCSRAGSASAASPACADCAAAGPESGASRVDRSPRPARCGRRATRRPARAAAPSPPSASRSRIPAPCGGTWRGSARSAWPGRLPAAGSAAESRPSASGTCAPDRRTTIRRPRPRPAGRRRRRPIPGSCSSSSSKTARSKSSSTSSASTGSSTRSSVSSARADRFVFQAVQQCVVQSATPQVSPSQWVNALIGF